MKRPLQMLEIALVRPHMAEEDLGSGLPKDFLQAAMKDPTTCPRSRPVTIGNK